MHATSATCCQNPAAHLQPDPPTQRKTCLLPSVREDAKARVTRIYSTLMEVMEHAELEDLLNVGSLCEHHPDVSVLRQDYGYEP